MKSMIITLAIILLSTVSYAQEIVVRDVTSIMSLGERPGFKIEIKDLSQKNAERMWKDYLRDYKAKSSKSEKNEFYSDDAKISSISKDPIDVYAVFDEKKDITTITVFFDLGNSFIDREHSEYRSASEFVRQFGVQQVKAVAEEKLKDEEKALKELEKDLGNLEKENEKLNKKIKDCQETIKEAEKDLKNNAKDQDKKKSDISNQKKNVETAKKKVGDIK